MVPTSKSPLQLLVQERTGREIEDLLRELYIARRWTHQEIAAYLNTTHRLNVSRSTVVVWCGEYGIDRADRTTEPEAIA
jgi:hypothetical protein